ncbi:Ig-like domain-containing protein [Neisseria sp. CCUG12390]|uniref:Ig-like domain-containing protein n=1 Tax=Neisseria sp. CCUG12390 TaxID=3392035 RepID=UPI003A10286A
MSEFTLHITRNGQTQIHALPEAQTLTLPAESGTLYQIFDSEGNPVAEPKTETVGSDLLVWTQNSQDPALILSRYQNYFSVGDSSQLQKLQAAFATLEEVPAFVEAQEITVHKAAAGMTAAALGTIGLVAAHKNSGSHRPTSPDTPRRPDNSEAETPTAETPIAETPITETPTTATPITATPITETPTAETPTAETPTAETPTAETPTAETPITETPTAETPITETPTTETPNIPTDIPADTTPPELTISINPVAADGTLNAADSVQTHTLNGKISGNETLVNPSVTVNVNGTDYPATVFSDGLWSLEIDGAKLAENQGKNTVRVKAAAADSAGNMATAENSTDYAVDTVKPELTVSINPVTADGTIDLAASRANHILSGTYTVGENTGGERITVVLNNQEYAAAIQQDSRTWTLPIGGKTLAAVEGGNTVSVKIEATDAAGNQATASAQTAYRVDTSYTAAAVTVDAIDSDGLMNAADSKKAVILSGAVTLDETMRNPNVTVTLNGQDKAARVNAAGDGWTLLVSGTELAADEGSWTVRAKLTATDIDGEAVTAEATRNYTVDTRIDTPSVTFDLITDDDIINLAESREAVVLNGSVKHARDGDKVKITIGETAAEVAVKDGRFSLAVAGSTLANHTSVSASVIATDDAGNRAAASTQKGYAVDLTPPSPVITLDKITADNVINLAESQTDTTRITGTLSNYNPADTNMITLRCVCSTCSGTTETVEKTVGATLNSDGTFTADVPTADLLKYDRIIAAADSKDTAQNTGTSSAAQNYTVILNPTITLDPVAGDNYINVGEFRLSALPVTGRIANVDLTAAAVTLKFYKTGNLVKEVAVTPDDTGEFAVSESGNSLHFNYDTITAVLQSSGKTYTASQSFSGAAYSPRWGDVALTGVAVDNILDSSETLSATTTVTGTFSLNRNPSAPAGVEPYLDIVLIVNGKTYNVKTDGMSGTFTAAVDMADLIADSDQTIDMVATLRDSAGNSAGSRSATLVYQVTDDHINEPEITIDPIATVNQAYALAHAETVLGGKVKTDGDTADSVITVSINNQTYTAQRSGDTWRANVKTDDLIAGGGEVTASVTATDLAGNSATAQTRAAYLADTAPPKLDITLDTVGNGNLLTAADLQNSITVSGKVGGEFKTGDTVVLTVGSTTVTAGVGSDGLFRTNIAAAVMQDNSSIAAFIDSSDQAGNTGHAQTQQNYRVSLNGIEIEFDPVTADNMINVSEQHADLEITGRLKGGGALPGQTVIVTVNGQSHIAAADADLGFKVKVSGQDLADNPGYTVHARVLDADNRFQAAKSHSYTVQNDVAAAVRITRIGEDNALGVSERYGNVRLKGFLDFGGSLYAQGRNKDAVEAVVISIGGKTYTAGFDRDDFSFHVDIPYQDYPSLIGQTVGHRFLTSNVNLYALEGGGSSKTVRSVHTTSTEGKSELTEIGVFFDTPAVNGKTLQALPQTGIISGTVEGSAQAGDTVILTVGKAEYTATVSDGLTFSAAVDHQDLSVADKVTAVLTTRDLSGKTVKVSDTAAFARSGDNDGAFVNPHKHTNNSQRVTLHSDSGYNFAYFIDTVANNNASSGGFLSYARTPFGGYDSNGNVKKTVLKYYFADTANDYSQGKEYVNANYVKAGTFVDMSETMKDVARSAYAEFSASTNILFEETANRAEADSVIMSAQLGGVFSGSGAFAFGGGLLVFSSYYFGEKFNDRAYQKYLAMHEIFHTLSAGHTDGEFSKLRDSSGNAYAAAEDYSSEYSSMSYSYGYHGNRPAGIPIYDLAYMHYRFGVNQEARSGNDIYSFGNYASLVQDGTVYIWDGAGVDTFDASAENEGVTVDLTPGSWIYRTSQLSDSFIAERKVTLAANDYKTYFAEQDLNSVTVGGNLPAYSYTEYVKGQAFIGYGTQIENLSGSNYDDILTGNNADNAISGNGGNDTIKGGAGNDYLDGGSGQDRMDGGADNDTYITDDAGDVLTEAADDGEDTVYSSVSHTLGTHFEHLHLLGSDSISGTGNASGNTLTGNHAANTLTGGMGNDTINGGRGSDTLIGGDGADTFVFDTVLDGSIDQIPDFSLEDTLSLDGTIFSALGLGGNVADHVRYHDDSGLLSYDADGSGTAGEIHFARLSANLGDVESRIVVA